jgi:hypothetical protein
MNFTKLDNIQYGKYRHYKTQKLYEIMGIVLHSETKEEMVIYKALYYSEQFGNHQIWVRPKKMFFENVNHNGDSVPRFKYIST